MKLCLLVELYKLLLIPHLLQTSSYCILAYNVVNICM